MLNITNMLFGTSLTLADLHPINAPVGLDSKQANRAKGWVTSTSVRRNTSSPQPSMRRRTTNSSSGLEGGASSTSLYSTAGHQSFRQAASLRRNGAGAVSGRGSAWYGSTPSARQRAQLAGRHWDSLKHEGRLADLEEMDALKWVYSNLQLA